MMFEKEKVEKHFKKCMIDAQDCKICKPYVNGIIKATAMMKESGP